jgi:hypothetical protein
MGGGIDFSPKGHIYYVCVLLDSPAKLIVTKHNGAII